MAQRLDDRSPQQEELAALLDVKQSYISQVENRENITLSTLFGAIAAMGGSIELTVNFPTKPSVQFSQIVVDVDLAAIGRSRSKIEYRDRSQVIFLGG